MVTAQRRTVSSSAGLLRLKAPSRLAQGGPLGSSTELQRQSHGRWSKRTNALPSWILSGAPLHRRSHPSHRAWPPTQEDFEREFRSFIGRNLLIGALLPASVYGVAKAAAQLVSGP